MLAETPKKQEQEKFFTFPWNLLITNSLGSDQKSK